MSFSFLKINENGRPDLTGKANYFHDFIAENEVLSYYKKIIHNSWKNVQKVFLKLFISALKTPF